MANTTLPSPTAEQRQIATSQFDRAHQVIEAGDYDYGIQLLKGCCKLDPANMIYRRTLRGTQRIKHKNNQRGGRFSGVTNAPLKLRLKKVQMAGSHLKVLEIGEEILTHNPWDVGTLVAVAEALDALSVDEVAVWTMELARQKAPDDLRVNRKLARIYEKNGQFTHANAIWTFIRNADPTDEEAQRKVKDLAASETISRGKYEAVLQTDTHNLDETQSSIPLHPGAEGESPLPRTPGAKDRSGRELENVLARIEKEPQDPNNYLQLARIYRRSENWDKVRETLQNGLQAVGQQFELAIELAETDIQPFRDNLRSTDVQLQKSPEDKQLHKLRLKLLKEINTREMDIYRQKADRYPTDMTFRLEMGVRLLQLGQIDEAISELQMARTDPRLHWKALTYLGFCFKARNNWRLAQRNFEDALRQLPADEDNRRKEILYQLARGCAEAGDFSDAIEWAYELANEDFGYKNIGDHIDEWQKRLEGEKS